jgi:two-component system, chemotaxis family, protein-glutamate methylesterase/glutaminase
MIRVLIVEDSAVVQQFLVYVLSSDPEIRVIGTTNNGEEALEFLKQDKPDVITMDIHMPRMDGFETTRKVMAAYPTPIVIVSGSVQPNEISATFRAIEAGALAIVPRPSGLGHPEYERSARTLIQTVKAMSEVKVVRRWRQTPSPVATSLLADVKKGPNAVEIVAIGASTGGPVALQALLSAQGAAFAAPIVIVQHMTAGFMDGFVQWLGQSSPMPVHVASDCRQAEPGHVYLAPDGLQMRVESGCRIRLCKDEPENGLRPSVSYLFRSVANTFGKNAVGVLLTGMGKDGAEELKLMKDKGALTIAQDKNSSVVHGMPGEAIRLGAASYVLPPDRIAQALARLGGRKA